MSARRFTTIFCDADGCLEWADSDSIEAGDDAASARRAARRMGWRVGLPGGRDLCPEHSREVS